MRPTLACLFAVAVGASSSAARAGETRPVALDLPRAEEVPRHIPAKEKAPGFFVKKMWSDERSKKLGEPYSYLDVHPSAEAAAGREPSHRAKGPVCFAEYDGRSLLARRSEDLSVDRQGESGSVVVVLRERIVEVGAERVVYEV